ncbi:hypothetical protein L6164_013147 [Bauhinia variegata]|uniref:Uncharacterized protein n=1 Tax=Bauhinia variegata TaxID=167791 RepID=A0ACB9PC59_BAUVA|nr:hypothetical protein L6164_013147 [Bauhinia variegata]
MVFSNMVTSFLVFFAVCFISTPTFPLSHRQEIAINIRNALPSNTEQPITLVWDNTDSFHLKTGKDFNSSVKVNQSIECTAVWLQWFASWDAYEPQRDKGHDSVYWLVKKNGFFISWDKTKWKKVEDWGTD